LEGTWCLLPWWWRQRCPLKRWYTSTCIINITRSHSWEDHSLTIWELVTTEEIIYKVRFWVVCAQKLKLVRSLLN
jgi:hypothetical protein